MFLDSGDLGFEERWAPGNVGVDSFVSRMLYLLVFVWSSGGYEVFSGRKLVQETKQKVKKGGFRFNQSARKKFENSYI